MMVIEIRGRVKSGLGKGRLFLNIKGYKNQFIEKLNFDPYPGTLNIKVLQKDLSSLESLYNSKGIPIRGFKEDGKTYGYVTAYHASISNLRCAVIIPHKTEHESTLEIIASENLRARLRLEDGDQILVQVHSSN